MKIEDSYRFVNMENGDVVIVPMQGNLPPLMVRQTDDNEMGFALQHLTYCKKSVQDEP